MDSRLRENDGRGTIFGGGLQPTRANENQPRHPRAGGGPRPEELDFRLRGNHGRGTIFVQGRILFWFAMKRERKGRSGVFGRVVAGQKGKVFFGHFVS